MKNFVQNRCGEDVFVIVGSISLQVHRFLLPIIPATEEDVRRSDRMYCHTHNTNNTAAPPRHLSMLSIAEYILSQAELRTNHHSSIETHPPLGSKLTLP